MTVTGLLNWKKTPHLFLLQTVVAITAEVNPRSQYKEQNSTELVSMSNASISSS